MMNMAMSLTFENRNGSYSYAAFFVAAITLIILSFAAFYGWADHILLFWDDEDYISRNSWITAPSLDGYMGMLTQVRVYNWHPLTWLSYVPEYYFCDNVVACYKTTNVFLHGINAFLVFLLSLCVARLLFRENGSSPGLRFAMAFLSASIFVVHPIHAESVVWVSERKDLLYSAFFMASMLSYLFNAGRSKRASLGPFIFFILALMSKPMAVTLPAVLVLLDWLLLGRYRDISVARILRIAVVEKAHFYLAALAVIAVTSLSQLAVSATQPGFDGKIVFILAGISHYVEAFLNPTALLPFYPMEIAASELSENWYASVLLIAISFLLAVGGARRAAVLLVGFFLVTVSPVSGLIQIGYHAFADRYAYMPTVSFFIALGLVGECVCKKYFFARYAIPSIGVVLLVLLTLMTRQHKEHWKNNQVFWHSVVERYPDVSFTAHLNMGAVYMYSGEYEKAVGEFERGIELNGHHIALRLNFANSLLKSGKREMAIEALGEIVSKMPESVSTYLTVGDNLVIIGAIQEASLLYEKVSTLEPQFGLPEHRTALILGNYQVFELALEVLRGLPTSGPDWTKTAAMINKYEKEMAEKAERLVPESDE